MKRRKSITIMKHNNSELPLVTVDDMLNTVNFLYNCGTVDLKSIVA